MFNRDKFSLGTPKYHPSILFPFKASLFADVVVHNYFLRNCHLPLKFLDLFNRFSDFSLILDFPFSVSTVFHWTNQYTFSSMSGTMKLDRGCSVIPLVVLTSRVTLVYCLHA